MNGVNEHAKFLVAGPGLSELPLPRWIRAARFVIRSAAFTAVATGVFAIGGWRWVTDAGANGLSTTFALWAASIVTTATATTLALSRFGVLDQILATRRLAGGALVFHGFRSRIFGVLRILAAIALPTAAAITAVHEIARTWPLPEALAKIRVDSNPIAPTSSASPIFFWDYSTWIDPTWAEKINVVVPYEKGPPAKLLSKVFFEDALTHRIVLELHGKRPRKYSPEEVLAAFEAPVAQPRDWPLLFKLEREAGLAAADLNPPVLYLMRIGSQGSSQVTQAIGVPWSASDSSRRESGHFFFWGPDGSVFQVKCPSPCAASRELELVQFPVDPRGSLTQRLEWTKSRLRGLLDAVEKEPAGSPARRRDETLVSLYLISMLTLDPRDPEAFFHLGKLARNQTTLASAIRYGRDLGLEHAKLIELESMSDREPQARE